MFFDLDKQNKKILWLTIVIKFISMTIVLECLDYGLLLTDMVENLYWGQEWQLGLNKHPPLSSWIAEIFMEIFNNNVKFYYLLSPLFLCVATYCNYLLSRKFLNHKLALLSVILFEGILYNNFSEARFNVNTPLHFFHPLICLFAYKICDKTDKNSNLLNWSVFGLLCGLAMLNKYCAAFVIISCILYIIYVKKFDFFKETGFYCGLILSILIFLPHFIWLIKNDFLPIKYVSEKSLSLLKTDLLSCLKQIFTFLFFNTILLIVDSVLILNIKQKLFKKIDINHKTVFLFVLLFFNIVIFIFISLIFKTALDRTWLTTHLFFLPILILTIFNFDLTYYKIRRVIILNYLYFIVFAVAIFLAIFCFDYKHFNIDLNKRLEFYTNINRLIDKQVNNYKTKDLYLCGSDNTTTGNISILERQNKYKTHIIVNCNFDKSSWIDKNEVLKNGLIVINEKNDISINIFDKPYHIDELINPKNNQKVIISFYKP